MLVILKDKLCPVCGKYHTMNSLFCSKSCEKGFDERKHMEAQANGSFTLWHFDPWSVKFKIKEASSFTVVLKSKLPISEIYERMNRAFGDLT